jgi:hypothetical protein
MTTDGTDFKDVGGPSQVRIAVPCHLFPNIAILCLSMTIMRSFWAADEISLLGLWQRRAKCLPPPVCLDREVRRAKTVKNASPPGFKSLFPRASASPCRLFLHSALRTSISHNGGCHPNRFPAELTTGACRRRGAKFTLEAAIGGLGGWSSAGLPRSASGMVWQTDR